MIASLASRCRVVLLLAGAATIALPASSWAQAYGTNQGACDRGALSNVLSTSSGNLLGSAAGAAVGGLLGNQFGKGSGNTALTVVGVLAGALAGGYVGRSMEPVDQACIGRALEHTPTNQTAAWQNPDTQASYWVTPTRTYTDSGGTSCRDYTTDAFIAGERQRVAGSSCRQADGSWKLQNERDERAAVQPASTGKRADRRTDTVYRGYSDRELHDTYRRLNEQSVQIKQDQERLRREMSVRGIKQ
jgi:surface antigen